MNKVISRVLSAGLLVTVALLLAGVVVALVRPDAPLMRETSLADLPRALRALEPGGFFLLGMLVLVGTPAARVIALGIGYARRREWMFVGFSACVTAVLVLSLLLGMRGG